MFKRILLIGIIFIIISPTVFVEGIIQINTNEETNSLENIETDLINLINQVNESILKYFLEKFVSFGEKMTDSENARRAADWIKEEFEKMELLAHFEEWKFPKYKDRNVIALHKGKNPESDAVILICAHYDTIGGAPGANDDGSGIAAMLTIANITKKIAFNHTVRFVALSGEEVGTYGSFSDAKRAYSKEENIIAVLNIDGIGYATEPNKHKIRIYCQERSEWIVDFTEEISEKYQNYLKVKPQHTMQFPCDHECYNDFGYDGVQFLQTDSFEWIHSPEDTIDKITFSYLINVTKLILAIAVELAFRPIDVQVRIIAPEEACIYVLNRPFIRLPCFNLYATRLRAITYIIGRTTVKLNITTKEDIKKVVFAVDGYYRHSCIEPPYEWKIGKGLFKFFRLKGFHRITAYVYTETDKIAHDEIDIFLLKII
jgi:hypothetical protein